MRDMVNEEGLWERTTCIRTGSEEKCNDTAVRAVGQFQP
jgi:hypothetical protein